MFGLGVLIAVVLCVCRLMLSAFVNAWLISGTSIPGLEIKEQLKLRLGFGVVVDSEIWNSLIAGLFG